MFTGIVQALETISSIEEKVSPDVMMSQFNQREDQRLVRSLWTMEGLRRIGITLHGAVGLNISLGASIAVNGTCLTAASQIPRGDLAVEVYFDVMQETLNLTNLATIVVGDRVNIERSVKVGDEIGGHHVSGHVDCTGTIVTIEKLPNNCNVHFYVPPQFIRFLIPKGWIAVDGVSLTVVEVTNSTFSVSLIPETLARTTLGFRKEGEKVNLEFDGATKTIVLTLDRILPTYLKSVQQ